LVHGLLIVKKVLKQSTKPGQINELSFVIEMSSTLALVTFTVVTKLLEIKDGMYVYL